jgi:phosphatidylethanolamine/phosphatidyl-N-methylethanolamine N-methyltransferase
LFLRRFVASPSTIGAIAPSSAALARAIAAQLVFARPGPILELGPGTGSITREILNRGVHSNQLTAVEYDVDLAGAVAMQFPGLRVLRGDVFDLKTVLANAVPDLFTAVISSIPLLSHPMRKRLALLWSAATFMQEGAPFIQFSYRLTPPVPRSSAIAVRRAAFVWKNIPPATVWVYHF